MDEGSRQIRSVPSEKGLALKVVTLNFNGYDLLISGVISERKEIGSVEAFMYRINYFRTGVDKRNLTV